MHERHNPKIHEAVCDKIEGRSEQFTNNNGDINALISIKDGTKRRRSTGK